MRFKYPTNDTMKNLNQMAKRLWKHGIFEFVSTMKQNIFYFHNNNDIDAICVIDKDTLKIDVFNDFAGFLTCHNLFSGDERSIDANGFQCLSLSYMDESNEQFAIFKPFIDRYKMRRFDKLYSVFSANHIGEAESIINNNEGKKLEAILFYLYQALTAFNNAEISLTASEDSVLVFEFDDDHYTYDFSAVALKNYSLLPTFNVKRGINKKLYNALLPLSLTPGTLYLSTFIGKIDDMKRTYDDVTIGLYPFVFGAMTDSGVFNYAIKYLENPQNSNPYYEALVEIFTSIGLYDKIITNNIYLYLNYFGTFQKLGISLVYSNSNPYHAFFNNSLKAVLMFSEDNDAIKDVLAQFAINYPAIYPAISNYDLNSNVFSDLGFTDDDEDEEEEENDFTLSSHIVS